MEKRNVPKLRFKGFEDEWEYVKLSYLCDEIKRTTDDAIEDILTISAGNGFLNQEKRFSKVIAGTSLNKYTLLYNGEFSYNRGNSKSFKYGCIYKLKEYKKALVPNVYISFRINNQNNEFYQQLFLKKYLDRQLRQLISSSARMDGLLNINKKSFFQLIVPMTSLEEQTKIANFLSNVDNIIEEQEGKVKDLELYKKGMMQKIFKQEIRFKNENGQDYPEWEGKKLKYILIEVNEKVIESDKYEVLSSTTNGLFKQSEYFNRKIASDDISGYRVLRLNQIVLSPQNLWLGNINFNNKFEVGIVSPSYKIFDICNNVNKSFISHIIKTNRMLYEYVQSSEQGASVVRRNLSMDLFYNIVVKLPCLAEQTKIANFLSNIDNIIEEENKKLEDLRQWKKGLLQQMFV